MQIKKGKENWENLFQIDHLGVKHLDLANLPPMPHTIHPNDVSTLELCALNMTAMSEG